MYISIYTPERPVVVKKEVSSAVIPAYEGEMGFMPGHVKAAVQLTPGTLRYTGMDGSKEKFAIMGGFAEFFDDTLEVFAEDAALEGQLTAEEEKQKIAKAKAALSAKEADIDMALAEIELKKQILELKKRKR